ncbi:MAG TPA: signal peptide peptidase SppA [Beijerinckiaceae bacterium]|nr:signal peptide peptidase SppA [Beijerinckiaceae bacterium]
MSLDADYLIDRRRLRRKLTLWRVLACAAGAAALIALGLMSGGKELVDSQSAHIARLTVSGLITSDKPMLEAIRKVKDAASAKAAIVSINSPGGTTTGSEALFRELRDLAVAKPTVAVVTGTAASGAYVAAIGTERIFAPETALIGSIGVIVQYPNFVKTLELMGVKVEAVRSSPLKAMPSGVEPTLPEARAALEASVADSYAWFKGLVKDRRSLSEEELVKVSDGRVFTGRQSVPLKLVDQIGSEKEAIAWLESEKSIAKSLKVRDYKRVDPNDRLGLFSLAAGIADFFGHEEFAASLRTTGRGIAAQSLDGLLSVWQPRIEN